MRRLLTGIGVTENEDQEFGSSGSRRQTTPGGLSGTWSWKSLFRSARGHHSQRAAGPGIYRPIKSSKRVKRGVPLGSNLLRHCLRGGCQGKLTKGRRQVLLPIRHCRKNCVLQAPGVRKTRESGREMPVIQQCHSHALCRHILISHSNGKCLKGPPP